ncbi:D-2-hydroxyacid dehydrogenase [Oceanobacillus sp. Castelsardo]|uniref:D-2-hydroxyacid dehydrogenase n=1 Tax=Oceanobacillus sp. Castelsardo TaxID=1851204 RepID=UPI000837E0BA|nr:D-2-hydroxyacid dehydrogenase [Oceanobacillus sp. Castelsardo]
MIVFSRKLADQYQNKLNEKFPEENFIYCDTIDEVNTYIQDTEVYVTYASDINEEFIRKAVNLKWIHVLSAGVDNLPFESIKKRGIFVTNVRGIHKIQMSEYAISMLLQVYRQEKPLIKNEENQVWDKDAVNLREITGKTMIVVGAGAIGSEVARLGKAFQMHTIGVSRSGKKVEHFDENYKISELNQVLSQADFVISVLPRTVETKDIFKYEQFKAMSNHVVFLNMGRGDAVIEEDLLKAIREGEIGHAILDVVKEEPLPKGHPFWTEENITLTPHLSGLSPEYVHRALDIFEENLQIHRRNEDSYVNQIDLTRGY